MRNAGEFAVRNLRMCVKIVFERYLRAESFRDVEVPVPSLRRVLETKFEERVRGSALARR
jgi:hypothetical protein